MDTLVKVLTCELERNSAQLGAIVPLVTAAKPLAPTQPGGRVAVARTAVTVLDVAVILLSFVYGFPFAVSVAVVAASITGVLLHRRNAKTWQILACAVATAVVFGLAAEGVRSLISHREDEPHRYFAVDQDVPRIEPSTDAPEARTAPIFPGDDLEIVCVSAR